MGPKGKAAIARCVRPAIYTWTQSFPVQAREQVLNQAKVDGAPERVYEKLFSVAVNVPMQEQRSLWLALAALLSMAPVRLSQLTQLAYESPSTKVQYDITLVKHPDAGSCSTIASRTSLLCYRVLSLVRRSPLRKLRWGATSSSAKHIH